MTQDELRAIALSMPEAEERSHFDRPDFRVRNKIFATLWNDGRHAVLKLDVEESLTLSELDPDAFSRASSRGGWTKVDLTTRVDRARIEPLVRAAWRTVAPKRLLPSGATSAAATKAATRSAAKKAGETTRGARTTRATVAAATKAATKSAAKRAGETSAGAPRSAAKTGARRLRKGAGDDGRS